MVNRRVTREDWIAAALSGIAEAGVSGLTVEGLSRSLGVTKGSFYHYFSGIQELLGAVLHDWELVATDRVIEALEALPEPAERLRRLFLLIMDRVDRLKAESALLAAAIAGDARVRPTYLRVNRKRLTYTQRLYATLGMSESEAEQFALTAYASYLGALQLVALGSSAFRTQAELTAHATHLQQTLIPSLGKDRG